MTEYITSKCNDGGFFYLNNQKIIELSNLDKLYLDEKEFDEYLSDGLTHEHIHMILEELFNTKVSKLFDSVELYFRNDDLHKKAISKCNGRLITWHESILQDGFPSFLYHCNVSSSDMIQAKNICNHRRYKP